MKKGIEIIAEERRRQIMQEGWTPEHDAQHINGELAYAASCYAINHDTLPSIKTGERAPTKWPWADEWWKPSPSNRIKELAKAGALIAAEIDRRLQAGERDISEPQTA